MQNFPGFLEAFRYELPAGLIAQAPPASRTGGRLLAVNPDGLQDRLIIDFPMLLAPGDLLVLNDTRVIKARLHGMKDTGGRIEALIERPIEGARALAQLRSSKPPKPGGRLLFADGALTAVVLRRDDDLFELAFELAEGDHLYAALDRHGELPLPPYIDRAATGDDEARYQTVFAREPGAVAAPTAGLHLDEAMLKSIASRGVDIGRVTLHVGAGTFQPVRVNDIRQHRMHAERIIVSPLLVEQVAAARARGGRVVAVGTTVVRALEAAALGSEADLEAGANIRPIDDETRIFITPGYRFKVIDALLTNFHLPESTLLMLACAFGGYAPVMAAYRHAVEQQYRFFSYGDAMWLPVSNRRAPQGIAPSTAIMSG